MINWIRKRLGYHVCEEFTTWNVNKANFTRAPGSLFDYLPADNDPAVPGRIRFIRRWQERACTVCGKVQQKELDP